jgi:hypothetical protein
VLQDQIFPNCEKLGQTIIFTRTRAEAARLHQLMAGLGYKCTSLRVGGRFQRTRLLAPVPACLLAPGAPLPLVGRLCQRFGSSLVPFPSSNTFKPSLKQQALNALKRARTTPSPLPPPKPSTRTPR